MPTDEDDQDGLFFFNHPERGATPLPRHAEPLLLLFRSNPLTEGGTKNAHGYYTPGHFEETLSNPQGTQR